MNIFAINIALALAWSALTANFTLSSLVIGFVLGYGALWLAQPLFAERSGYFQRTRRVLGLTGLFLYELVISSLRVVWDVLTPEQKSRPRVVEMPLEVDSDFAILLVTNLITLTPGTLSLDVTRDRKMLVVHAMFADDPDEVIAGLKRFEARVKEVVE